MPWALLERLHQLDTFPWLCMGNFNEILCQRERRGTLGRPLQMIIEAREAMNNCQLIDLGFKGVEYMWDKN
jgi:hypothetical protein